MIDIVGRRYFYFLISALVIVPGLLGLIVWGPPTAGIDFTGGSLLEIRFASGLRPQPAQVVTLAEGAGVDGALVQTAGDTDLVVRSKPLTDAQRAALLASLEQMPGGVTLLRDEHVGPSIGSEVGRRALVAVALAVVGILGYITLSLIHI